MLQIPEAVEGMEAKVEGIDKLLPIGLTSDLEVSCLILTLSVSKELNGKNYECYRSYRDKKYPLAYSILTNLSKRLGCISRLISIL